MPDQIDDLDTIITLLRQTSSVDVARDFLRSVKGGVRYSANSWEDVQARMLAALEAKAVNFADLWAFQRDAEEHGQQHIFLYRGGDKELTSDMLDVKRVQTALRKAGLAGLGVNVVVDKPTAPTITNTRLGPSVLGGQALTIKIVETRIHRRSLPKVIEGDIEIYKYVREPYRGVNVVRFHSDGTLEIRIREHTRNDESGPLRIDRSPYKLAMATVREVIAPVLPYHTEYGGEESLMNAKRALWNNHEKLESSGLIQFNLSALGHPQGTAKFGSRTPDLGLGKNPAMSESISAFMKHKGAWHEAMNLWWLKAKEEGAIPSKAVHVRIGGAVNEFSIPVNCTGQDYNHVFGDIKRYNRKTA